MGSGVDVGSGVVGIALGADADDPATDDEGPAGVAVVGGACDTVDLGGGGAASFQKDSVKRRLVGHRCVTGSSLTPGHQEGHHNRG